MFGLKRKVEKVEKKEITELEYLVENMVDDIEEIIMCNKLKIKFSKTKVTVNTIKFYFELYISVNESDNVGYTKMKQITSLAADFERLNKRMIIKTEDQMVVFEIPRIDRQMIKYSELFNKIGLNELKEVYKLPMILGVDEHNEIRVEDLADKPHIFIAGTTGSGKSVSFNGLICTWLQCLTPDKIQFAFIDPKGGIELSFYEDLNNYLFDDIKVLGEESVELIYKIHAEMTRRYKLLKENKCKKIEQLNDLGIEMPRLILGIDEFANVTTTLKDKKSKDEFDTIMSSILQMGRACGIHCLFATQRPTVDVMNGGIKANVVFRLGFLLPTSTDSKTVIDGAGLEKLIGEGDGLIFDNGNLTRFQSPFISEAEIEKIVENAKGNVVVKTPVDVEEEVIKDNEDFENEFNYVDPNVEIINVVEEDEKSFENIMIDEINKIVGYLKDIGCIVNVTNENFEIKLILNNNYEAAAGIRLIQSWINDVDVKFGLAFNWSVGVAEGEQTYNIKWKI